MKHKYLCVAFVNAAYVMGPFETVEAGKNWGERYNAVTKMGKAIVVALHSPESVLQSCERQLTE